MENSDLKEKKLITKCIRGNTLAQRQLFDQYAQSMYNVAFRIMGSTFEAEDAFQEAFIKVFDKLESYKYESTLGAWIKRIVINQCLSELRRRKLQFESINESEVHLPIEENENDLDENAPIELVMNAVAELPEKARIIFTLKAIEQLKFNEISEMTGLSENNCKVQYHRSKQLLREKLKRNIIFS